MKPRPIRFTAGDTGVTLLRYWAITEDDLATYLHRAHIGETPDDLMLEILLSAVEHDGHSEDTP